MSPTAGRPEASRAAALASALRLLYLTLAWNVAGGIAATAAALMAGSLSLGGFGLNAVMDSFASATLVWRFRGERTDPSQAHRVERRSRTFIGLALATIGASLALQAIRAIAGHAHPRSSTPGALIAVLSILVLPPLAVGKGRAARALRSRALRGDAALTAASAGLAAVALGSSVADRMLGWWWADAVAALLIAAALGAQAVELLLTPDQRG